MFKPGTVILTEGKHTDIISWCIYKATGSWITHCFIVVSDTELVEAWFPRVHKIKIADRLNDLRKERRDYYVYDLSDISDEERKKVVDVAVSYVGQIYDVWNLLYYVFFKAWFEGGKRLTCSSLVARAYKDGGRPIFTKVLEDNKNNLPHKLLDNWQDAYCTPEDILAYSDFDVISKVEN